MALKKAYNIKTGRYAEVPEHILRNPHRNKKGVWQIVEAPPIEEVHTIPDLAPVAHNIPVPDPATTGEITPPAPAPTKAPTKKK